MSSGCIFQSRRLVFLSNLDARFLSNFYVYVCAVRFICSQSSLTASVLTYQDNSVKKCSYLPSLILCCKNMSQSIPNHASPGLLTCVMPICIAKKKNRTENFATTKSYSIRGNAACRSSFVCLLIVWILSLRLHKGQADKKAKISFASKQCTHKSILSLSALHLLELGALCPHVQIQAQIHGRNTPNVERIPPVGDPRANVLVDPGKTSLH